MENPRRALFKQWFAEEFGEDTAETRAAFLERSGQHGYAKLTKGRLSQLFDEDQPFGELSAINTARRLGLKEDAFLPQQMMHLTAREMAVIMAMRGKEEASEARSTAASRGLESAAQPTAAPAGQKRRKPAGGRGAS